MDGQGFFIGTSGWSYKHWKDIFYPPEVKSGDWFLYYCRFFDTAEINTSFYHLPREQTVINWANKAPGNFTFCTKLSRYITHLKKLRDVDEPLQRFFGIFEPLKSKMGPVLVQLPPLLRFNYDLAEAFFRQITSYKGYDFVLEVRHQTWLHDDCFTLMARYGIGLVISQSGGFFPYSEMVTAQNIYIRFHGPTDLYASAYSDEMLMEYSHKIKSWLVDGHKVWAYFNNDIHGHAFRDAQRLKSILKEI